MHKKMGRATAWLLGIGVLTAAAGAVRAEMDATPAPAETPTAATVSASDELYPISSSASDAVKHGRYLAMAGDCAGCHTVDRSKPFAGGLPINTPFGAIYTTNISSDPTHGIGKWTFDQFYTAMHDGMAPGFTFLYPAFPYTSFTKMPKQDVHDLWDYMHSVPAVAQANHANDLRFPFSFRPMMFFWRVLFFSPQEYQNDPKQTAEWNRGAYLASALGHCQECHSPRGWMSQLLSGKELSGGVIDNWWAPNITGDKKSGIGDWSSDELVEYLRTGSSAKTSTFGPMGIIVEDSLQFLKPEDLKAIAVYLQSQSKPAAQIALAGGGAPVPAAQGKAIYESKCLSCHEWNGAGLPYGPGEPGVTPPLAGNPTVGDADPRNVAMVILNGSIEPNTEKRPLPYAMPAFAKELNDQQIAAVVNYTRSLWGDKAPGVSAEQVKALRGK